AFSSCVLVALQIAVRLPPAPKNKAAEARATNAINSVYSIRSCPSSSCRKRWNQCMVASPALAGLGGRVRQLRIGGAPDRLDAAARAQEQGRGSQRHEGDQECVFDQVLPLLVFPKLHE